MTIAKGEPWGRTHDGPPPTRFATDDADLARLAQQLRAAEHGAQREDGVVVGAGDAAATLGLEAGGGVGVRSPAATETPTVHYNAHPWDLGWVELGTKPGAVERELPFVAHVLARQRFRPWPPLAVMNVPLYRGRRMAPRAHPNDGVLDVISGALDARQGRQAWTRAVTASHLPHPDLTVQRADRFEFDAGRPVAVAVDGRDLGRWRWIRVGLTPDAVLVLAPIAGEPGV